MAGLLEYTKNGQVTEPPLYRFMRGNVQSFLNSIPDPSKMTPEEQLAMGLNANPIMGLLGITAYHGSPYLFEQFDPKKVGTGVGQQLFGKGTYFAESPEVAKSYQVNKQEPGELINKAGEIINAYNLPKNSIQKTAAHVWDEFSNLKDAKNRLNQIAPEYLGGTKEEVYKEIVNLKNKGFVPSNQPSLYKVDIPDEIIPNMLQWDKPLGEQSTGIQKLAMEYAKPLVKEVKLLQSNKLNQLPENSTIWNTLTGSNLYKIIKNTVKNEDELTGMLQAKGIPGVKYTEEVALRTNPQGIKYMDTTGEGTNNYVLFDPTIVKMLETKTGLLK